MKGVNVVATAGRLTMRLVTVAVVVAVEMMAMVADACWAQQDPRLEQIERQAELQKSVIRDLWGEKIANLEAERDGILSRIERRLRETTSRALQAIDAEAMARQAQAERQKQAERAEAEKAALAAYKDKDPDELARRFASADAAMKKAEEALAAAKTARAEAAAKLPPPPKVVPAPTPATATPPPPSTASASSTPATTGTTH